MRRYWKSLGAWEYEVNSYDGMYTGWRRLKEGKIEVNYLTGQERDRTISGAHWLG